MTPQSTRNYYALTFILISLLLSGCVKDSNTRIEKNSTTEKTTNFDTPDKFIITDARSAKELIAAGDSYFVKKQYDLAARHYEQALAKEPNNYYATIFLGNTYYARKDSDPAIFWFKRATQINPNIETAHRWWSDIYMARNDAKAALDKTIDAMIAEPYNKKTHAGLNAWLYFANKSQANYSLNRPVIHTSMQPKGKALEIDTNFGQNKKLGHAAWFGYGLNLMMPKNTSAAKNEYNAYMSVIAVATELQLTKSTVNIDPSLATLLEINEQGLLMPYIFFNARNQKIANDYPAYRDKNKALLKRYWLDYVIRLQ